MPSVASCGLLSISEAKADTSISESPASDVRTGLAVIARPPVICVTAGSGMHRELRRVHAKVTVNLGESWQTERRER